MGSGPIAQLVYGIRLSPDATPHEDVVVALADFYANRIHNTSISTPSSLRHTSPRWIGVLVTFLHRPLPPRYGRGAWPAADIEAAGDADIPDDLTTKREIARAIEQWATFRGWCKARGVEIGNGEWLVVGEYD